MEFKEKKNHYLHPDFEDIDIMNQKKPSPLALLAQTCKNIGSKEVRDFSTSEKLFSPNSTLNGFKKKLKRCRSDCSSSSSSFDREHFSSFNNQNVKERNTEKKRKIDSFELKSGDSSSEASFNSTSSLLTNLLHFVKVSPGFTSDNVNLSQFIKQCEDKDQYIDLSKPKDYSNRRNHFNVSKAYHLESNEVLTQSNYSNDRHSSTKLPEKSTECSDPHHSGTSSPIKYCMYCGKLIPVLQMLLAHIRMEHATSNAPESTLDNSSGSNIYEILSKFNPSLASSFTKPDQSFLFLSDYFGSSFHGLHNLIC